MISRATDRLFDETVARVRSRMDRPLPKGWPRLHLPRPLAASIARANELEAAPPVLVDHYGRKMPELLLEQLLGDGAAVHLLWRALEPGDCPGFDEALNGLERVLLQEGLSFRDLTGSDSPQTLLSERRSIARLFSGTLFGTGLPLLGAYPAEREVLTADLHAGMRPEAVIDLRLGGNIVHEICHGRPRDTDCPLVPWALLEAAAIHLGAASRLAHVFPVRPGEAVPGVALFVLLGEGLARLHGRRSLWRLSMGASLEEAFGPAAPVLEVLAWQDWLRRQTPPFAENANDAVEWIKLADAVRGPSPLSSLVEACSETDRSSRRSLEALPDLVAAARDVPWSELPWGAQCAEAGDDALLEHSIRSMFVVNRIAPTFQTHPDDPPDQLIEIDLESSLLKAKRRSGGVFAEPARWLFPPPLSRQLASRGARRILIEGARRSEAPAITDGLRELCVSRSSLSPETSLKWKHSQSS